MREFGESGSSGGRRDAKPAGTRHVALSARATTPRCPKASSSTLQAPLQHNPSLSRFSPPYTSNHAPDAVALTLRIVQSLPRPLAHAFSIASPVTLAAPFRHAAFSIPFALSLSLSHPQPHPHSAQRPLQPSQWPWPQLQSQWVKEPHARPRP